MYLWLANGVTLLHGMLVIGVVSGTAAAIAGRLRRWPRLERLYYFLVACVLTSQFVRGECILTVLEKTLRTRHDPQSSYHNSCLLHYMPWLPLWGINVLGPALIVLGLLSFPFWRLHDRRQRKAQALSQQ